MHVTVEERKESFVPEYKKMEMIEIRCKII